MARKTAGTAVATALLFACAAEPKTQAACPSYPPVINVQGATFYVDPKGSKVDHAAEQENNDRQAPVFSFLSYIFESVDGAPSYSKIADLSPACANTLLEAWAKAGALRTTNDANGAYSRQGGIDRQSMIRSFVIVALKLKQNGQTLGPDVVPWLGRLVDDNNRSWQKNNLRGNLYYWSGATAAAYALLSGDPASLAFQNQVWADAMAAIRPDGTLPSELTRGSRALIYHQYALSALLTLRAARQALHATQTPEDARKLRLLADRVGASLCHPEQMAALAHVAQEEMPGEWGYREIAAFGGDLLGPDWSRCGVKVQNFIDQGNGGDQRRTRAMFASLS
jgi:poly(beta-D-mannuronate) lyase